MRIALFNVSGRLSSDGSRLISALLKRAGHSVLGIFLARPEPLVYEQHEFQQLDEILKQVELVMVAVYSSYAIRAVQITNYIHNKYPGMKVIWGGPHCISAPELGLKYADGVCFSEGDQVVVELVNKIEAGIECLDTPNMAFNVNGTHVVNDSLPPFDELDSLPYYDYQFEDQYLLDRRLFLMTKERFRERNAGYPFYIPTLHIVTSRGCPHICSYCNNCRYIKIFGHNKVRFYSVDRIIEELRLILEDFDFIRFLAFGDDDFFARPINQLEDFAQKYKKEVGIPFGAAVSANSYRKEKMEILLDAGLIVIGLGIQSGSQRILDKVYNRNISVLKTKKIVHQIESYMKTHQIELLVDFIIDNPYESKDDIMQTYQYMLDLPLKVRINLFFLAFSPGTPLYERAIKDGIIKPFDEKIFRFYTRDVIRFQKNYETLLILMLRKVRRHTRIKLYNFRWFFRILGSAPIRTIASILPRSFFFYISKTILK